MDGEAWWATVHGVAKSRTERLHVLSLSPETHTRCGTGTTKRWTHLYKRPEDPLSIFHQVKESPDQRQEVMSYLREDVHSHRVPLEPPHLLSPVPLQSCLHRLASGRTLDSPLIKPRAVWLPTGAQCHSHGPPTSGSTSPMDTDTPGPWPGLLKDDPCQQPVLGLRSARAFHGLHHESEPCSVPESLPDRTDKKEETQQVSVCPARLQLCGAERGGKERRRGACGHPGRTPLLRAGRRACTHITHNPGTHTDSQLTQTQHT